MVGCRRRRTPPAAADVAGSRDPHTQRRPSSSPSLATQREPTWIMWLFAVLPQRVSFSMPLATAATMPIPHRRGPAAVRDPLVRSPALHSVPGPALLKTLPWTTDSASREMVSDNGLYSAIDGRMLYKTTSLTNVWPSFKNGAVRRAKRVPAVSRPWLTSGITGQG